MRHDFIVKAVVLSKLNKAAMRELANQLSAGTFTIYLLCVGQNC
jgi:hypothetical protein